MGPIEIHVWSVGSVEKNASTAFERPGTEVFWVSFGCMDYLSEWPRTYTKQS